MGTRLKTLIQSDGSGGRSMPVDTVRSLKDKGYWQCPGKTPNGRQCDFWLSPSGKHKVESHNGYFTCPHCHRTYDLLEELPFHGVTDGQFEPGGSTRIGIPLADQGQIGENIVAEMGEIPGYGPIVWWHPGGANSNAPLDGATKDWGIEVKTINYDAIHHRFNPGGEGPTSRHNIEAKNREAERMGLKGILGILVLLDYRRDKADIYVKEMPLEPWEFQKGRTTRGVSYWRKHTGMKLAEEVPFKNPFKDPHSPVPTEYRMEDYYERPPVLIPHQLNRPKEDWPF